MVSYLIRNKISLLVCDMAGTVINEKGQIYKSLFNTLKDLNYNPSIDDMESWGGKEKRHILTQQIYKSISRGEYVPADFTHMVDIAEEKLIEDLKDNYFNKPGISLVDDELFNFFDCARINGIKIVLNTGYSKEFQQEIVNHFNFDLHVDDFISSEEVKYGRPYPYMIHELMTRFDIQNPKHVAKVGDTKNDMKEGVNACCGINIGVLSGLENKNALFESGADVVVNKITDLNQEDDLPVFLL
jgi:phosphonatase-like hydrolase